MFSGSMDGYCLFHINRILNERRVQVLLVKNEKEHAWAINSRNIH